VIPVLGFATLKRFDLADRLLASIDYPVENLVIVDNSGQATWNPDKPDFVVNMWVIRVPFGLGLVGAWNLIIKSTPYAPYWLLVNDDCWFAPESLSKVAEGVLTDAVNFFDCVPAWSAVAFGEGCIDKVGLYDERFYPLYFDDNDLERRIDFHNVPKNVIDAKIYHDNSSTLHSGFQAQNSVTYSANQRLFSQKVAQEDYSEGAWSLRTRRDNRWD
jgi:GT2 family glycosyltransferase